MSVRPKRECVLLWEGARAALEVNWVAATILGRVAETERIERELLTLQEEALAPILLH